jgi:hypothetical protein
MSEKKILTTITALFLALLFCTSAWAGDTFMFSSFAHTYRNRDPYLISRKDDNGRSMSTLQDLGDTIKVTNVDLMAYNRYEADTVEDLSLGETFVVAGRAFQVYAIKDGEMVLRRKDAYGNYEFEYLVKRNTVNKNNGRDFYIAVKRSEEDGSFDDTAVVYTGDIVFSKTCTCYGYRARDDVTVSPVSFTDYSSLSAESFNGAVKYGLNIGEETFTVCGSITMDDNGIIVSYTEK